MNSSNQHSPPQGLSMAEFLATEGLLANDDPIIRRAAEIEQRVHEMRVELEAKKQMQPPPPEVDLATLGLSAQDLLKMDFETDWLIPGLCGRDWVCMVSGREKGGKSVLLFTGILGPLERGEQTVWDAA